MAQSTRSTTRPNDPSPAQDLGASRARRHGPGGIPPRVERPSRGLTRISCARSGRPSWRRCYYGTRNAFWSVARNLSLAYGIKRAIIDVIAMENYAVQDCYVACLAKGDCRWANRHGFAFAERTSPKLETIQTVRELEMLRPSFLYYVRHRIFRRGVGS